MTLNDRIAALVNERERLASLHARAVDAVNQAAVDLVRADAQIVLLQELVQEQEQTERWPPSGA